MIKGASFVCHRDTLMETLKYAEQIRGRRGSTAREYVRIEVREGAAVLICILSNQETIELPLFAEDIRYVGE